MHGWKVCEFLDTENCHHLNSLTIECDYWQYMFQRSFSGLLPIVFCVFSIQALRIVIIFLALSILCSTQCQCILKTVTISIAWPLNAIIGNKFCTLKCGGKRTTLSVYWRSIIVRAPVTGSFLCSLMAFCIHYSNWSSYRAKMREILFELLLCLWILLEYPSLI